MRTWSDRRAFLKLEQDLYAKALAVEDQQGNRVVFLTLDLIGVIDRLRSDVTSQVQDKYKLDPAALLMNASHTHCGPVVRIPEPIVIDIHKEKFADALAYSQKLEKILIKLIGGAAENSAPSKLSYHRAKAAFAMNRRLPTVNGYRNSPNPSGPVDHDVPVLKITDADGKLKTILFGYACHNTTLGIFEFCGDYAGFAQTEIEKAHPGVVAMFVMGCGGDQNPYPRRRLDYAMTHGKTLAIAVEAALETPSISVTGPLQATLNHVEVNYAPGPGKEELEARLSTGNKYTKLHAKRLLHQLEKDGKLRSRYSTLVQTFQFGDSLTLVALPGETVVDYSLRLKHEFPDQNMWVAGYSNDGFAYIPSERILKEGGYEGGGALIYTSSILHPGPFESGIEERILQTVYQSLGEPTLNGD